MPEADVPANRAMPPVSQPIKFTQHVVTTVESWPARTHLPRAWLDRDAHLYGAVLDPETDIVTFTCGNGTARYQLNRRIETRAGILADRIDGTTNAALARRGAKFARKNWGG